MLSCKTSKNSGAGLKAVERCEFSAIWVRRYPPALLTDIGPTDPAALSGDRERTAPQRPGRRRDKNYNFKERLCCKLAAHATIVNLRCNLLLQLAKATGSAGTSRNHKKSVMRQSRVVLLRQNTRTIIGIAPVTDIMYFLRRGQTRR